MSRFNLELVVGIFVAIGVVCFGYLAIKLGDLNPIGQSSYTVDARFDSISGLNEGAAVEVAGVQVGEVESISLDHESMEAIVSLTIDADVKLQEDSIASIRSTGLIGDKFVNITPGGTDIELAPGDEIIETESSVSLEELISKYIFQPE